MFYNLKKKWAEEYFKKKLDYCEYENSKYIKQYNNERLLKEQNFTVIDQLKRDIQHQGEMLNAKIEGLKSSLYDMDAQNIAMRAAIISISDEKLVLFNKQIMKEITKIRKKEVK